MGGGIFEIVCALSQSLSSLGLDIEAVGLADSGWALDRPRWLHCSAEVFKVVGPGAFGFSPSLKARVWRGDFDLLHLHALWMYPSLLSHQWTVHTRRPFLVTPNGMLDRWALANSRWKKQLAGVLYERASLNSAACLQANTTKELADIRNFGLRNPVCVIPNGVDLPEHLDLSEKRCVGLKQLLFLGRLHPKKGLMQAIRAWALMSKRGLLNSSASTWQFVIAGWDQGQHESQIKSACAELGITFRDVTVADTVAMRDSPSGTEPQVVFAGPAFGQNKDLLLRTVDAFILPSLSEGLPMAVLEAWSYALPVLMTPECNIPEGFDCGAAIRLGLTSTEIANGMEQLFLMSDEELLHMGSQGRDLVHNRFTWPAVAAEMKLVYEWLLGGGPAPSCVVLS
ncbi:MAG: glycosyltransferase [Planctomyces sp.]